MMDPHALIETLFHDGDTWATCGVSAAMGALGGLAHLLVPTTEPVSWLRRVVLGAVAAVAILWVARPTDGVALIASSLVAGYAGEAIMAALEAKSKLLAAQNQVVEIKQEKQQAVADVQRAITALEQTVPAAPPPGGAPPPPTFGPTIAADTAAAAETLRDLRERYRGA